MGVARRDFLKLTGAAAIGLGAKPALDFLSGGPSAAQAANEEPLVQGTRYGMAVIVSKLTEKDCKAAMEACHLAHNVPDMRTPDGEVDIKHEIKWIWETEFENAFPGQAGEFSGETAETSHFLILCNHCTDPPCCRVCPTQATFKSEKNGIVVMDMHRCIGCRFCMAGCPYGSRSFNFCDPRPYIKELNYAYPTRTKGVVEKCNFCAERIFKGQQPACVEAVKSGALVFGDLNDPGSELRKLLRENHALRRKPELGTGPNIYYIV